MPTPILLRTVFYSAIVAYFLLHGVAHAQLVNARFDRLSLSENFDSASTLWTMVANNDNLFIVQDGEYILNRKTNVSPFAVLVNMEQEFSSYRIVTSLKLEKSGDENASVGLIFMSQPDGKGGFIFELNKFQQYRIKEILPAGYKYITADQKSSGWIKSESVSEPGAFNLVDLKTDKGSFDFYVNNNFVFSFTNAAYKSGRTGIIIGASSKGKADFFYLFTGSRQAETLASKDNAGENANEGTNGDADMITLAESIITLKSQINKLKEENDLLRSTIEAMKGGDREMEKQKTAAEISLGNAQAEIKKLQANYDSLMKVNSGLEKYREMVAGNENSDLIITLSKTLKAEKESSDRLRQNNRQLSDSIAVMKIEMLRLQQQKQERSDTEKKAQTEKPKNEMVLPKDN